MAKQASSTEFLDLSEWTELGARLAEAGPTRYADVLARLRSMVEAQEVIAQYDDQLFLRGGKRPTKRYQA